MIFQWQIEKMCRGGHLLAARGGLEQHQLIAVACHGSVQAYLVIGNDSGSHSRSVVIHVVSSLCLVAIFHTVKGGSTCPSFAPAPPSEN